jgi:Protein of unknown function (DUF1186)
MTNSLLYRSPVDQLLQAIELNPFAAKWPDYLTLYGLAATDLPELMRLSLDEDPPKCKNDAWMFHALIAVTQLDPVVAIDLYVQQLYVFAGDELLWEAATRVCRMAGKAAIEPCAHFLQDLNGHEWSRSSVIEGLETIVEMYPDCREACVQVMFGQLHRYQLETSNVVNSALVDALTELQVVEAAGLIEEVFKNCELDEYRTGSWPSVQVRLGLKSESDFTEKELKATPPPAIVSIMKSLGQLTEIQAQLKETKTRSEPKPMFKQAALSPKKPGFGGGGRFDRRKTSIKSHEYLSTLEISCGILTA